MLAPSIGKISYFFFFYYSVLLTIIVIFPISLNRIDASRDKNSRMLIVSSLRTLNINVDKYTYIYIYTQGINIFAELTFENCSEIQSKHKFDTQKCKLVTEIKILI